MSRSVTPWATERDMNADFRRFRSAASGHAYRATADALSRHAYRHVSGAFFTPMALDIAIAEQGGRSVLVRQSVVVVNGGAGGRRSGGELVREGL
jgi:hypothetical protein